MQFRLHLSLYYNKTRVLLMIRTVYTYSFHIMSIHFGKFQSDVKSNI